MDELITIEMVHTYLQKPFNFSIAEKAGEIELPKATVEKWKAGQKIIIEGVQYIVSKEILPNPGNVKLWRDC